jgi:hypothetical protein
MRIAPVRLNGAIAWLFMIGSACFVLGSVPAFVNAVGGTVDSVTYFVGSLFFTSASLLALLQAQTPAMTQVTEHSQGIAQQVRRWAWLPHDRAWLAAVTQFPGTLFFNVSTAAALIRNATVQAQDRHVWRPDFLGSTLFLISSAFGILAVGGSGPARMRSYPWSIAWLNMIGSVLFMASAVASYILPSTGQVMAVRVSVAGTLLGAVCFLVGAALMLPAWRASIRPVALPPDQRQTQ